MNVTEGAHNPLAYAAITDSQPIPRRVTVSEAKCNNCHDSLRLHGGQRIAIQECVMCHNPNASDVSRRAANAAPPESIDFKRMIHRIHTGEELTQEYSVYGFGGTPINFNHVLFPGDRRDCQSCHVAGEYQLPLGEDNLPTETLRDFYSPQQPTATSCLGCHDTRSAAAHAFVNTAPFGEACASCHGPNAEFAVDKVHAR
jgi:OmcA/MtrC family decaheme c-type cytochrome